MEMHYVCERWTFSGIGLNKWMVYATFIDISELNSRFINLSSTKPKSEELAELTQFATTNETSAQYTEAIGHHRSTKHQKKWEKNPSIALQSRNMLAKPLASKQYLQSVNCGTLTRPKIGVHVGHVQLFAQVLRSNLCEVIKIICFIPTSTKIGVHHIIYLHVLC
jgi:hypothetical protein